MTFAICTFGEIIEGLLLKGFHEKVALVCIDPPFFVVSRALQCRRQKEIKRKLFRERSVPSRDGGLPGDVGQGIGV
jgi:hypothetical protein